MAKVYATMRRAASTTTTTEIRLATSEVSLGH
jgi:hypothetical protein